jgi:hypothetical protein
MPDKIKRAQKIDPNTSNMMDRCQTPPYALDPLRPFIRPGWRIWEPACGNGNIVMTLQHDGYSIVGTDILHGHNFLNGCTLPEFDCIITNPPYTTKYLFLKKCYQLGKPFALLVPIDTLGSGEAQAMFMKFGVQFLFLNRRVNFDMPYKGMTGKAKMNTFWLCWKMLPSQICYGYIPTEGERS